MPPTRFCHIHCTSGVGHAGLPYHRTQTSDTLVTPLLLNLPSHSLPSATMILHSLPPSPPPLVGHLLLEKVQQVNSGKGKWWDESGELFQFFPYCSFKQPSRDRSGGYTVCICGTVHKALLEMVENGGRWGCIETVACMSMACFVHKRKKLEQCLGVMLKHPKAL